MSCLAPEPHSPRMPTARPARRSTALAGLALLLIATTAVGEERAGVPTDLPPAGHDDPPAEPAPMAEPDPARSLLGNGGFESTELGIRPWVLYVHATQGSYVATQTTESARTGQLGVELRQEIDEEYGALAQHVVHEAEQAQPYRLSAWLRGRGIERRVALNADITNSRHPARHFERIVEPAAIGEGWARYDLDVEIDAGRSSLEVLVVLYGPGTLHVDDVTLTPLP